MAENPEVHVSFWMVPINLHSDYYNVGLKINNNNNINEQNHVLLVGFCIF